MSFSAGCMTPGGAERASEKRAKKRKRDLKAMTIQDKWLGQIIMRKQ
jgi:hypothetical protein